MRRLLGQRINPLSNGVKANVIFFGLGKPQLKLAADCIVFGARRTVLFSLVIEAEKGLEPRKDCGRNTQNSYSHLPPKLGLRLQCRKDRRADNRDEYHGREPNQKFKREKRWAAR